MKKFINDLYDVVDEMLEGFLDVHKKYVRKLDAARTVVRTDAPVAGKVGVITGGGSGHKPAFIGFVGQGMLDAVDAGIGITCFSPLGGGLLTGKYQGQEKPEPGSRASFRTAVDGPRFWHPRGYKTAEIVADGRCDTA